MRLRTASSLRNSLKQPIAQETFNKAVDMRFFKTDNAYFGTDGLWHKSPDKVSIIDENGVYRSTVGTNYVIEQNRTLVDRVFEAFTDGNVDYKPLQFFDNGTSFNMVVELPQFNIYTGTGELQTAIVNINNGIDTFTAASIIEGLIRQVCTNGMMAFDSNFNYRMIHKGDMVKKASEAIELYKQFDGSFARTKQVIERLGNTTGKKSAIAKYVGDGEVSLNPIFKGERWAAKLLDKWQYEGEPTNLWDMYNIFTDLISHEYGNKYSSKLNKQKELNKEVSRWSNIFEVEEGVIIYG